MLLGIQRAQVDACRFEQWYETFKNYTIKSLTIPMNAKFCEYLKTDGVRLPQPPQLMQLRGTDPRLIKAADEDTYEDFGDVDWDNESQDTEINFADSQSDLDWWAHRAIEDLGGEVFVKCSWTCPRDAAFINSGMKCRSSGEIFLLLKSSDLVIHDLEEAYSKCWDISAHSDQTEPYLTHIVLRKWANINPSMEFRCFIVQDKLVAIVQRSAQVYYDFLHTGDLGRQSFALICKFFKDNAIIESFPVSTFTVDVYVDRRNRVWILDFGVLPQIHGEVPEEGESFVELSDSLLEIPPHDLLSWEVLLNTTTELQDPIFLTVTSPHGVHSSEEHMLRSHRFPIELSTGELNPEIFEELRRATLSSQ